MVGAKEALVVMYHGLAGVEFQEALLKPFECSRYAAALCVCVCVCVCARAREAENVLAKVRVHEQK